MVNREVLALAMTIMLAGCVNRTQPMSMSERKSFDAHYNSFDIRLPVAITNKIHRHDESDAYLNYDYTTAKRVQTDFSIEIYPPGSIPLAKNTFLYECKENSIKDSVPLENDQKTHTFWGRVPDPPCYVDQCDFSAFGYSQYKARYVLCSEYADKSLRIEIDEVTDNPAFAENIFKTFHWAK